MLILKYENTRDRQMVWSPGEEILVDEFMDDFGKYPYDIEICKGEFEKLTHQEIYQLEVMLYPHNDVITVT